MQFPVVHGLRHLHFQRWSSLNSVPLAVMNLPWLEGRVVKFSTSPIAISINLHQLVTWKEGKLLLWCSSIWCSTGSAAWIFQARAYSLHARKQCSVWTLVGNLWNLLSWCLWGTRTDGRSSRPLPPWGSLFTFKDLSLVVILQTSSIFKCQEVSICASKVVI